MKLTVFFLFFLFIACSSKEDFSGPDPVEYPIVVSVIQPEDSIRPDSVMKIEFLITQKEYMSEFVVSIDTIVPYYYTKVLYDDQGEELYLDQYKVNGTAIIEVNGKALKDTANFRPGVKNIITFSGATVVGTYKIVLNVSNKYGQKHKSEIKLEVYSPEMIVKFYEVDPWIDLGYDRSEYYECLNRDLTYEPLSPLLKGKRVDTIYTIEESTNLPVPGSWTIPGRGIICYIAQEGNQGFLFSSVRTGTTSFSTLFDGDPNAHEKIQKDGFHAIDFDTWEVTNVGTYSYQIILIDHWGKRMKSTITIKALDRNSSMPATGHRLPD